MYVIPVSLFWTWHLDGMFHKSIGLKYTLWGPLKNELEAGWVNMMFVKADIKFLR